MATEGLLKIAKTLCPYCNGSSPESHCQCGILTKAAMEGSSFRESMAGKEGGEERFDFREYRQLLANKVMQDKEIERLGRIIKKAFERAYELAYEAGSLGERSYLSETWVTFNAENGLPASPLNDEK